MVGPPTTGSEAGRLDGWASDCWVGGREAEPPTAGTAYDVSLNDDSWPQEAFEIISGSTSKIVEKHDPFQGSPAVIKYRVLTNAALQRLVGKYGPLVSVVSFVGIFVSLVASPSKSSAAKGSKKKR
ncbi:hypothetical protein BAE44_0010408 [Dichanthelium oligosanthes]|uniref:Uncharacterized protein n=1 Tax=Dichanthelium oligosanthes TaxID=888268 RepID=A0A1E5VTX5_9POAL|nr:hypothetical protein BAE44_0010408 [Dichanthelium oligosanthes]